ncbi:MAG: TetR/AcrR family transcriptional regulator [Spirochaetota bacterium]
MGSVREKAPARLRILQATADSLTRKGYSATGLNEIIAESGAPKGSLYHYFPDGKEQLAVEALALSTDEWFSQLSAIMNKAADPSAAIRMVCKAMAKQLKESKWENGCPIATVTLEVASTIPAIQQAADTHWKRWHEAIRAYFCRFDMQVPDALITTAIAAFEGGLLLSRAHRSEKPLLQVGETLAPLFENLATQEI